MGRFFISPVSKKKKELRDERFAREYLIDLNGAQAAIRAGFAPKSARVTASKLLTKPNVKAIIEADSRAAAEKLGITAVSVLRELQLMGFSNMQDYSKKQSNGTLRLDFSQVTREQAAAIQEITTEEFTIPGEDDEDVRVVTKMKFKLADKRGSLELLGKHLKLFNERLDLGNADGKPLEILVRSVGPTIRPATR